MDVRSGNGLTGETREQESHTQQGTEVLLSLQMFLLIIHVFSRPLCHLHVMYLNYIELKRIFQPQTIFCNFKRTLMDFIRKFILSMTVITELVGTFFILLISVMVIILCLKGNYTKPNGKQTPPSMTRTIQLTFKTCSKMKFFSH